MAEGEKKTKIEAPTEPLPSLQEAPRADDASPRLSVGGGSAASANSSKASNKTKKTLKFTAGTKTAAATDNLAAGRKGSTAVGIGGRGRPEPPAGLPPMLDLAGRVDSMLGHGTFDANDSAKMSEVSGLAYSERSLSTSREGDDDNDDYDAGEVGDEAPSELPLTARGKGPGDKYVQRQSCALALPFYLHPYSPFFPVCTSVHDSAPDSDSGSPGGRNWRSPSISFSADGSQRSTDTVKKDKFSEITSRKERARLREKERRSKVEVFMWINGVKVGDCRPCLGARAERRSVTRVVLCERRTVSLTSIITLPVHPHAPSTSTT